MDIARPEETDVPFDPLEVVEHVLTAENLPFDRTDDGDLPSPWPATGRTMSCGSPGGPKGIVCSCAAPWI